MMWNETSTRFSMNRMQKSFSPFVWTWRHVHVCRIGWGSECRSGETSWSADVLVSAFWVLVHVWKSLWFWLLVCCFTWKSNCGTHAKAGLDAASFYNSDCHIRSKHWDWLRPLCSLTLLGIVTVWFWVPLGLSTELFLIGCAGLTPACLCAGK
jgi:hypothetical protein